MISTRNNFHPIHANFSKHIRTSLRNYWFWVAWENWDPENGFEDTSTDERFRFVGHDQQGNRIELEVQSNSDKLIIEVELEGESIGSCSSEYSGHRYENGMDETLTWLVRRIGVECAIKKPHAFPVLAGIQAQISQSMLGGLPGPHPDAGKLQHRLLNQWLEAHVQTADAGKRLRCDRAVQNELLGEVEQYSYENLTVNASFNLSPQPHLKFELLFSDADGEVPPALSIIAHPPQT